MFIEWNDKLKTGLPIIDEQHQDLVVMLNRLGRLKCGKESFLETFSELEDYSNIHFKTEEDLMIKTNYPRYEEHKHYHEKLKQIIKDIGIEINKNNFDHFGEKLHDFAQDWIINHYSTEDICLVEYIKKSS